MSSPKGLPKAKTIIQRLILSLGDGGSPNGIWEDQAFFWNEHVWACESGFVHCFSSCQIWTDRKLNESLITAHNHQQYFTNCYLETQNTFLLLKRCLKYNEVYACLCCHLYISIFFYICIFMRREHIFTGCWDIPNVYVRFYMHAWE